MVNQAGIIGTGGPDVILLAGYINNCCLHLSVLLVTKCCKKSEMGCDETALGHVGSL